MRGWASISSWQGRSAILASIIVIPFTGFLVSHDYPITRLESVAALLCLSLISVALAALCRHLAFYALALACGAAISVVPLQRALSEIHTFSVPAVMLGIVALAGGLMLVLRQDFFRIVVVFALSAFGAHLFQSFLPKVQAIGTPPERQRLARPAHFLYLVLDEHMGPAGLPAWIPECREASEAIESTFRQYGFRLYPFAYANFSTTLESLPSVMNRQIPGRRRMLLQANSPDAYGIQHVSTRGFFDEFRARGYGISVFQYGSIDYSQNEAAHVVEYSPKLGEMADVDEAWTEKFRLLVGTYQASNLVLAKVKGFLPFRFGVRSVGPLSVAHAWPGGVAEAIVSARRPTFFFVHLMTPHGPYLYREDGSVRRVREWDDDLDYRRLDRNAYVERYIRYAGQVEFVQGQLRRLLGILEEDGLLDQMTVVVHGDHGSRIRRSSARNVDLSQQVPPDLDDYTGEPEWQDVMDRFSVLLAVKQPHARRFSTVERKGSILSLLSEEIYRDEPSQRGSKLDSVFLFDEEGNAKEIRVGQLWNH